MIRLRQVAIGLSLVALALPAAALAAGAGTRLFFSGDMVVSQPKGVTGPHCVLNSQFKHGQIVIFRERVLDQAGKQMSNADLKSLVVKLPSGKTIPLRYGGHPHNKPVDHFWAGSWKIPAGYPTGSLGYKVVATLKNGSTQSWTPFNVELSQLTVVSGDAKPAK